MRAYNAKTIVRDNRDGHGHHAELEFSLRAHGTDVGSPGFTTQRVTWPQRSDPDAPRSGTSTFDGFHAIDRSLTNKRTKAYICRPSPWEECHLRQVSV